jgi:anaphase-promoting complex subunit 8
MCELHYPNQNEAAYCERLLSQEFFPNSLWIMSLRATILFILHGKFVVLTVRFLLLSPTEHADAEAQFTKILSIDPERIDNIDIYSNILYLTNNKLKLSSLAHDFLALDKDRPEVCCVVGELMFRTSAGPSYDGS